MELIDTIDLMNSSDFKDRFKAEYYQLVIRINKLNYMIESYKAGTLAFEPKCGIQILANQVFYMNEYKAILERRAAIEGIDLNGKLG